jgi:hypothetical protein
VTIAQAIRAIQQVGSIESYGGVLRLRFPATAASELQAVLDVLRSRKSEVLTIIASQPIEVARAYAIVNRMGVRIIRLETGTAIGVWSDLDGPEVRNALRTLGFDQHVVAYLDDPVVPVAYKCRRVARECVPLSVLKMMKGDPREPWRVRDEMLSAKTWASRLNMAKQRSRDSEAQVPVTPAIKTSGDSR